MTQQINYFTYKLKKSISILFLICLAANPLFNIGYYGYFKLNIDEIIEKYCVNKERPQLQCNGQCHLMKTLSLSQDTTENDQPATLSIIEAFTIVFFQENNFEIEPLKWLYKSSEYAFAKEEYQQPLLHIALPPPQV